MSSSAAPAYDRIGVGYAAERRPDPRWAAALATAVGDAGSVVNVGAGAGSYEPASTVVAVEPSPVMAAQRRPGLAPAVRAGAEALPLADGAADVALVVLSLHHWSDWRAGVAELRRVSRRQVVLTFDGDIVRDFWLVREYLPEAADLPFNHPPPPEQVAEALGGASVEPLLVPHDLSDAVLNAAWRRPERYLDPAVLAAASSTAALPPDVRARGIERLRADLATGEWHRRHADLLTQTEFDGGLRLLVTC